MRVVIAEDQVLLREGLARLFEDGGHEVVASLEDAEHLLAAVAGHHPDLVVLDVRMPPSFTDEGARAAKQIKEQHPELGVLVLSQHIETAHAVELVSQGASAICSRTACSTSEHSSRQRSAWPRAARRWILKS